jgi:transcriptional regulator with XRE-family HTH domain
MSRRIYKSESQLAAEVGQRIREVRIEKGLSLKEFGKKLGVSGQQIQKYETGGNVVPLHRLLMIASLCSLSPESFWNFAGPTAEIPDGADLGLLQLVRAYKRIGNPRMKQKVLQLVREIALEDTNPA